ncbi:MAG: hypothetical protein VW440_06100 [Bordetella sp.]
MPALPGPLVFPVFQAVCYVILPSAMLEILTGMCIAIGFGRYEGPGQMMLNAPNFL